MTEALEQTIQKSSPQTSAGWQIARYVIGKVISLGVIVVLSVFLIIIIANYGGYIDQMKRAEIDFSVGLMFHGQLTDLTYEERIEVINETRYQLYEAAGLNEPFLNRAMQWLWGGLALDFGTPRTEFVRDPERASITRALLLERMPRTLAVFGTANLLIFFSSIAMGLYISRRYDGLLDRLTKLLAPISTIPAWFYGVLLGVLAVTFGWTISTSAFLILIIFLAGFFQTTYIWRSFFLMYSEEDYVEMAKARGLSNRLIQRRYLVRPALPTILTNFALMLISLFMGSIVLEAIFNYYGIGHLFYRSILRNDMPTLVSIVVLYAYLLAITVFILDMAYAVVDPRIRVGGNGQKAEAMNKHGGIKNFFQRKKRISASQQAIKSNSFNQAIQDWLKGFPSSFSAWRRESSRKLRNTLREINRYPAARRSLLFVIFLFALSIFTVATIPYDLAISLWRGDGQIFIYYPREAQPEWLNYFRDEKLPPTMILDSAKGEAEKMEEIINDTTKIITITYPIEYNYVGSPQDLALYFNATYEAKEPLIFLYWDTPDGRRIKLADVKIPHVYPYNISQSQEVQRKMKNERPERVLFTDENGNNLQGDYALVVEAFMFEMDADVDAEFVMRGQVYGWAGTDFKRRDIMVELLWGLPIVLAFGLLGAVATNVLSMLFAAASAWHGGWLDGLIQRITELNMALPAFPISLMVFVMYSKSIWVILAVTVILGIFGSGVKTYRATFLQIKEENYIEAARAYGASNTRIVFLYLLPRIVSILVPQIIVAIPSFVFLEASLAFLGVSDPVFPTWGKLLVETFFVRRGSSITYDPTNMLYYTHFYTGVLLPAVLLILLALSFNTLGSYMEKVLNPRLRSE